MHELALCEAIANVVKTHADGRHVEVVRVRVGALRQVVPESLSFCWTLVRDSENMADAELELRVRHRRGPLSRLRPAVGDHLGVVDLVSAV